jgi:hypothetical protein
MHSSRRQPQTQPVHSFSVSDQGCSPICRHCKQQCSAMAPGHGGTLGSILQNWQASRRAGAGRLRYSFRTCSYRRIWLYAVKCAGLVIEESDLWRGSCTVLDDGRFLARYCTVVQLKSSWKIAAAGPAVAIADRVTRRRYRNCYSMMRFGPIIPAPGSRLRRARV